MEEKSILEKLRKNERLIRRNLFIATARKVIENKQLHEIGMRDIADEAGVSVASLYRYFPSRDDLLVEALIQEVESTIPLVKEKFLHGHDNSFEGIAMEFSEYLLDNRVTFQLMTHFMLENKISPETSARFNAVQNSFLELFDQVLMSHGVHHSVRMCSQGFYAALMGTIMMFRNHPDYAPEAIRHSVKNHLEVIIRIFQTGVTRLERLPADQSSVASSG